jgi:hypothetical protein
LLQRIRRARPELLVIAFSSARSFDDPAVADEAIVPNFSTLNVIHRADR